MKRVYVKDLIIGHTYYDVDSIEMGDMLIYKGDIDGVYSFTPKNTNHSYIENDGNISFTNKSNIFYEVNLQ